jgi:integrase
MAKKRERGNGTGTVYPCQNKQGKIISYHGPDGKRRYVSAKKKGECQRRLREAMTDADRGLIFDRPDLKLGECLDSWLSDSVKDTVRQRTWERYESICRVHIKPTLGRAKLRTLTSNHLRALYRDKLDAGLAPRTVNYIHVTLHKALNDAVSDGLVPKNVASAVKSPRPDKPEIHPLTREQARMLLEAASKEDDRFEALYGVALHC